MKLIKELLQSPLVLGIGTLVLLSALMWFVHTQRDIGRADIKAKVAEQTIGTINQNIEIDKEQDEIRAHVITDAELYDSLYNGSF